MWQLLMDIVWLLAFGLSYFFGEVLHVGGAVGVGVALILFAVSCASRSQTAAARAAASAQKRHKDLLAEVRALREATVSAIAAGPDVAPYEEPYAEPAMAAAAPKPASRRPR